MSHEIIWTQRGSHPNHAPVNYHGAYAIDNQGKPHLLIDGHMAMIETLPRAMVAGYLRRLRRAGVGVTRRNHA